jgi:cobalt-zinc-cadmium efflux system outer membrane protein
MERRGDDLLAEVLVNPMFRAGAVPLALLLVLGGAAATGARAEEGTEKTAETRPAADLLMETLDPALAALVAEVLERNPDLARLRSSAEAAAARAPQMRSLPDPMASVTAFLLSPETRVGPQQAAATVSQRFPWFGKLELRERQALLAAAAARAEVEAKRLALVTETRRLGYELAFLAVQERVLRDDRATLGHYEELARARYASGVGLEQAVIKLQAEITRDDTRLLDLANRRAALVASLDVLRDRPAGAPLPELSLSVDAATPVELDVAALRQLALANRPEIERARSLIAAAETGVDLAKKESRPDLTVGLGYTLVGKRRDAAGRAMPPPDNGNDVLGVTLGFSLPVWRERIAAGVAESSARSVAAEDELRAVVARISGDLDELAARLPLIHDQLELFENVLATQAEEALRSAEGGYAAGSASALDLLDAERVQLEVRIATARSRADYLITRSRLEGVVGAPLSTEKDGGAQ